MAERMTLWNRLKEWLRKQEELERWVRLVSPALLYGALDERLSFREAVSAALEKKVPAFALKRTMCLGGTALLLFVNQVITGVLLAIYYKPSAEAAYGSVRYIEQQVAMGWLIRQMHAWGAALMIIFVLLHVIKVFFNKAYRPPRELTWVFGTFLLFITLTFGFTGYLLPWDELSYWASTVGTSLADGVPVVGHYLLIVMRGGEGVTGLTISRFFAVHCIILPWITFVLLIGHFMVVRRLGLSEPL